MCSCTINRGYVSIVIIVQIFTVSVNWSSYALIARAMLCCGLLELTKQPTKEEKTSYVIPKSHV